MLPMADGNELSCALDLEELGTRAEEIERLGAALVSRSRVGRGQGLRFAASPGARGSLEALIAAERECCPFLELKLREEGGELALSVSAPPEGEAVAEAFALTFGEPRRG